MKATEAELSSFLAIKGAFIEETYRAFRDWDLASSPKENLDRLFETNSIGASSTAWLKNIIRVLKQRYDVTGPDRSLVLLAQQGWHIEDWRPLMLWHICRTDELLRCFLADWLFEKREEGIVLIGSEGVRAFLAELIKKRLGSSTAWKDSTIIRVANGLLGTAVDFQLMRGRAVKEFETYRLPDPSFLYLLHALMERENNTRRVIDAADWRLFLMHPQNVEEELLRLHQFGKLRFERAGTFLELTLPCKHTEDFVRSRAG
jgi:hypothetical protein